MTTDNILGSYTLKGRKIWRRTLLTLVALYGSILVVEKKMVSDTPKLLDHPREVWVRHSYDVSETPQRASYFKRRGVQHGIDIELSALYQQYPIPIRKAKADDLGKLLAYIPAEYQFFYFNLTTEDTEADSDSD